jgi:hypothetical protein
MYKQGDIFLVLVPYNDLTNRKQRHIVRKKFGQVNSEVLEEVRTKINELLK